MKYRAIIKRDEDGIFIAKVPALPGCVSQGRTREEAVANIKKAIATYLKSLKASWEIMNQRPCSQGLVK